MQYERLTHVEHILKRPDTYVGSLAPESSTYWTRVAGHFEPSVLNVSPGLVKIFDEILVNAIDQYSLHVKKVSEIRVDVSSDSILIQNSGVSIPIKKHATEKIWIPELIFGHLLTSSNYNDDEQRVTGGRNGYGAKLANVFSSKFWIAISDGKKIYKQTWHANMSRCDPPTIENVSDGVYVRVGFSPDWSRFGGAGDFAKVVEKRTWDAALWCPKAKVYLNSKLLEAPNLEEYAKMHGLVSYGSTTLKLEGAVMDVVVGHSTSGGFQQCSWVNGIATNRGGSHVDKVTKSLVEDLTKD
jgi:DNA topoisomerase-2